MSTRRMAWREPTCIPRPRRAAPGPRSRRRRRRDFPGSGRSDGRPFGRFQRGARRAALPCCGAPEPGAGPAARRLLGCSGRAPGLARLVAFHFSSEGDPGRWVACRTAGSVGAVAVLCLAFPLHPPGRPDATSRLEELERVSVPVLVVQGSRDPFGMPPPGAERTVAQVAGNHSLKAGLRPEDNAAPRVLPRHLPPSLPSGHRGHRPWARPSTSGTSSTCVAIDHE